MILIGIDDIPVNDGCTNCIWILDKYGKPACPKAFSEESRQCGLFKRRDYEQYLRRRFKENT